MGPSTQGEIERRLLAASRALGAFTAAAGALVLLGWALDIERLKSLDESLVSVKPNAASCLLAVGAALALRSERRWRPVVTGLGAAVALVGALTAVEWLAGIDLGIDALLFTEPPGAVDTTVPGRMSLNSSLAFLALGTAVPLLDRGPLAVRIAQGLGIGAGVVGLVSVVGYLYGATSLLGAALRTPIALRTAIGVLTAALAVLLARADSGVAAVLASRGPGGLVARRLLPVAIALPPVLALLVLLATDAGLLDRGTADGTGAVVLVAALVWITMALSSRLDTAHAERGAAEARLAESERRYRSLFDNMTAAFAYHRVEFDRDVPRDYVFLEINAQFEAQTGLRRADVLGRRATEVIPGFAESGREWVATFGEVARTRSPVRFERFAEALDRWYAVSAYSPEPGHCAVVFQDVTEQKRHEQELARLNQTLELRTRELTASNAELEAFAYSVSHDLRAPLRSMAGFSQAVLEDSGERLDETARGYLRRAVDASRDMGRLIDDLLALSRVTRVEMARVPVDLAEIARAVAGELRRLDPDRAVTFVVPPRLEARGDPALLRLVLQNLLGNAWKFTARHATARIELGAETVGGRAAFFVADDGAGFEMAYAGKLMKPFQRLHASHEFPGTGVGLATVNRIVRRHGGEVWLRGEVEKGATVWFTLPETGGRDDAEGDPAR